MMISISAITVDCSDPDALATFWAQLLGYERVHEDDDEVAIAASDRTGPELSFFRVRDGKATKNRLHLDLAPDDQASEVERAKSLGATEVDIGQGDVSWVVLADPEGNEFCILSRREPDASAS